LEVRSEIEFLGDVVTIGIAYIQFVGGNILLVGCMSVNECSHIIISGRLSFIPLLIFRDQFIQ